MFDESKESSTPPHATTDQQNGSDGGALVPANEAYAGSSDPYGAVTLPEIPAEAKDEPITGYRTPAEIAEIPPKPPPPPRPSPDDEDDGGDEEKGMLRMSFMEHLEELRSRLLRAIGGMVVVIILCIGFCKDLWAVVSAPAVSALQHLGINPPNLTAITPME